MSFLRTISSISAIILTITSCSDRWEYKPEDPSGVFNLAFMFYPENYFGDIENLTISSNVKEDVLFVNKVTEHNGEAMDCIQIYVPLPDHRKIVWNKEHTKGYGYTRLYIKSELVSFEINVEFCETIGPPEIYGNSSIDISRIICGDTVLDDDDHSYLFIFRFNVLELAP